jgi:GNAT superfamily N-acetyltransferase
MMSVAVLESLLGGGVTQRALGPSGYRNLLAGADRHEVFGATSSVLVTTRTGVRDARLTLSAAYRSSFQAGPVLDAARWGATVGADTVLVGCAPEAVICLNGLTALGFTKLRTVCTDVWTPAKADVVPQPSGVPEAIDFGVEDDLEDEVRTVAAAALAAVPELAGLPAPAGPLTEFSSSSGGWVALSREHVVCAVAKLYVDSGKSYHDVSYVRPEHRRQGVGARLRAAICRYAVDAGWSSLTSTYLTSNHAIARINASLGYERTEETVYLVCDTNRTSPGSRV